jgi:hypothetical protein
MNYIQWCGEWGERSNRRSNWRAQGVRKRESMCLWRAGGVHSFLISALSTCLLLPNQPPPPRFSGSMRTWWGRYKKLRQIMRLGLYPKIIRTCRQVATESNTVHYGENTFLMTIFQNKYREQRAYFVRCDHFGLEARQRFGDRVKDLRRLEITRRMRAVCCVLCETYKLDYLRIKLDGRGHFNA